MNSDAPTPRKTRRAESTQRTTAKTRDQCCWSASRALTRPLSISAPPCTYRPPVYRQEICAQALGKHLQGTSLWLRAPINSMDEAIFWRAQQTARHEPWRGSIPKPPKELRPQNSFGASRMTARANISEGGFHLHGGAEEGGAHSARQARRRRERQRPLTFGLQPLPHTVFQLMTLKPG